MLWFSDQTIEGALYDSQAIRRFVGIDLGRESAPDATIIAAPSSTKNRDRARDPEMHQTKKGNQWHFGMKAHIGVDAESGLTHTLVTTPAHTADVTVADQLLHGEETLAFGDAVYRGVEKRAAAKQKRPHWHVAMRPGKRRALPDTPLGRIRGLAKNTARLYSFLGLANLMIAGRQLGMKRSRIGVGLEDA